MSEVIAVWSVAGVMLVYYCLMVAVYKKTYISKKDMLSFAWRKLMVVIIGGPVLWVLGPVGFMLSYYDDGH